MKLVRLSALRTGHLHPAGNIPGTQLCSLCYKSEGRWFDFRWCHWNFSLAFSSRSHYGPGVDSASNRNEYQGNFLGVNAAGAYGWQPYQIPVPLSWNLGTLTSWNPLGHSRPVTRTAFPLLRWKPVGRVFDSRWCHWNFSLT